MRTRQELEARVRQLEARERARTEKARAVRLENRKMERARLVRQVRLAASEGRERSDRAIVRDLQSYGWRVSRGTVAAILRGLPLD